MNEKIKQLIEEKLGLVDRDYSLDSRFKDLGCDSLDLIDLIMDVEREFDIMIPDEDVTYINTVQDLIDYVNNRISVLQEDR